MRRRLKNEEEIIDWSTDSGRSVGTYRSGAAVAAGLGVKKYL